MESPSLFGRVGAFLSRYPLIPRDDEKQAVRIRHFLMASATYAMTFLLGYLGAWLGAVSYECLNVLLGIICAFQVVFYIILRTSLNLRLTDPSLTELQMVSGILFLMYMKYFAYEASGIYIVVYLLVFLFGVFRLSTRQFLKLTAFSLVTYGIAIGFLYLSRPGLSLAEEFLRWAALAILLTCFSFIGGYISTLRRALRDSHRGLERAMETIQHMANRDDLTGLLNRRFLMELLERESRRVVRSGQTFSLIMLDIDDFKKVNDTMGHLVGDTCIKAVAGIIQESLRATDFSGRYGGDEFVIVLIETGEEGARNYAERLRRQVERTSFQEDLSVLGLTVSIGIAEYRPNEDLSKTISRADEALYRAKKAGRNRTDFVIETAGEKSPAEAAPSGLSSPALG